MLTNQVKLLTVCLIICLLFSCTKSKIDISAPEIELLEPDSDQAFLTGSSLDFQANFTDDISLSSFVVEMRSVDNLRSGFDTVIKKSIYGISSQVDFSLPIPLKTQGGRYELVAYCTDRLNNESPEIRREINLLNASDSEFPKLKITSLELNETNVIFKGGNLVFLGEATDNKELGELFVKLYRGATNELYNELDAVRIYGKKKHTIGEFIAAPRQAGWYRAEITVSDAVNNRTTLKFDLEVR